MPKLTDEDRNLIAQARKLRDADVQEHTGETDITMAYVRALGQATHLLGELADRLEQLGS